MNKNKRYIVWHLLLILPIVAMLWVPSYAKQEPTWMSIPLFYWYQSLWVILSSLIMGIVYFFVYRKRKG